MATPNSKRRHKRVWTPAEEALLRREWHEAEPRTLRTKLGRTWLSISNHARVLGLPQGIPQGCETVTQLMRRLGFSWTTVMLLLEHSAVRVKYCYPCSNAPRPAKGRKSWAMYVDVEEARKAAECWLEAETVHAIHVRTGIGYQKLWIRAQRRGWLHGDRRRARLAPSQVQDLLAEVA